MAAGIMREEIARRGLGEEVEVLSAGVWAADGGRASANATAVLRGRGIDLASHRSQPVTPALLRQASIVLVMEEAHRRSIFHLVPDQLNKVFLLSEMTGGHDDVEDPFGGSIEEYAETADELTGLIEKGLPRILKRIGVSQ